MIVEFTNNSRHFLPLQEHTLRNTSIFYFSLSDVDGLVRKIIVYVDWSDSVVLKSAFDHMFLEVGIVTQDLPIILEPGRLNTRNVVILRSIASFHESEAIDGLAHLVNQVLINIFLQELLLLLL